MKILVGTDIESVQRFKILVKSEKNLVKNIFFESEYNYAISKVNPEQSFTGIWCAKEAVVKVFSQIKLITVRE
jgi:holo-[acyl-carrier protein] synthase